MRTRWIAGIVAASAVALAAAVSVAQRADRARSAAIGLPRHAATELVEAVEDPVAAVEAFVRRNRNEADDSIQALSREAETLRARLAKVEAALARWQAVAGSLNSGQKWGQPDEPTELSPIEPAPVPGDSPTRPIKTVPDTSLPSPFDPPVTVVPTPTSDPSEPSKPTEPLPADPPPRN